MAWQKTPLMELHLEYLRLLAEKTNSGPLILEARYLEYKSREIQLFQYRMVHRIYEQLAEFTKKQYPELSSALSGKSSQMAHEVEQHEAYTGKIHDELCEFYSEAISKLGAAPDFPHHNIEEDVF